MSYLRSKTKYKLTHFALTSPSLKAQNTVRTPRSHELDVFLPAEPGDFGVSDFCHMTWPAGQQLLERKLRPPRMHFHLHDWKIPQAVPDHIKFLLTHQLWVWNLAAEKPISAKASLFQRLRKLCSCCKLRPRMAPDWLRWATLGHRPTAQTNAELRSWTPLLRAPQTNHYFTSTKKRTAESKPKEKIDLMNHQNLMTKFHLSDPGFFF